MSFVYQLHTPAQVWPSVDALAVAVNAQAGLGAQVTLLPGNTLRIQSVQKGRTSHAALTPFDSAAYAELVSKPQLHVTQAEQDAVHRFQRTVVLATQGDTADSALCQVTIADALWWLLGGLLEDPGTATLWGRRDWRACTLRQHAADLLALGENAIAPLPPPQVLPPLHNDVLAQATITVYTLPYCRHCVSLMTELTERGLAYQEVDVTQTPGGVEQMMQLNGGKRAAPTVRVGHQVLVGPEPEELDAALRAAGLA